MIDNAWDQHHLMEAAAAVLRAAGRDPDADPAIVDTPERYVRAWQELTEGSTVDPAVHLVTFDAEGHDDLVLVANVPVVSVCEHHLLPFHGTADVAYLPAGRVLGLSKVARIVDAYARRPQVQERLTRQVADLLDSAALAPAGVAVRVRAVHTCMNLRGARATGSTTTTIALRGAFRESAALRAEALGAVPC